METLTLKKYKYGMADSIARILNGGQISKSFSRYFQTKKEAEKHIRNEIRKLDRIFENAPTLGSQKVFYSSKECQSGFFELTDTQDVFIFIVDKNAKFVKLDKHRFLFPRNLICKYVENTENPNIPFEEFSTLSENEDFIPEDFELMQNSKKVINAFENGQEYILDKHTNIEMPLEFIGQNIYSIVENSELVNNEAKYVRITNQIEECDLSIFGNMQELEINSDVKHIILPQQLEKLFLNCKKFNTIIPSNIRELKIKSDEQYELDRLNLNNRINLEKLTLIDFHFTNKIITPIMGMSNLRELNLIGCDIKTIPKIQNLEKIDVSYNNFVELPNIIGLDNLKELNVSNNKIEVLNINLPNLEKIIANNNKLKTVNILLCSNLIELNLSDNNISKITLENKNIKILNLANNRIEKFNFVECDNLEDLNMSNNKLGTLHIENILSIKKLNFENNILKNVYIFLPQLEEILLSGNIISKLNLTSDELKKLDLSNITGEILLFCNRMEELNLTNTQVDNLDFLENAISLQELFINKTNIRNIDILKTLNHLRIVHIDYDRFLKLNEEDRNNNKFIFMN